MVLKSPLYKTLKTDSTRKSHNSGGVANREIFMQ